MTLWKRGLVKSREKLKLLYLQYHSAYSQQVYKMVIYLDGLPSVKSHDSLITKSFKITFKIKLGKTVSYLDRILPIKLNLTEW